MIGSKTRGRRADAYATLLEEFPLRPIHTDGEYEAALGRVESLLDQPALTLDEDDYLEVLSDLIEHWEDRNLEVAEQNAVEMVRGLLADRGWRQKDLVPVFGTESIVSEVLAGKRDLQRKHIEALSKLFSVSPAVFFPDAR